MRRCAAALALLWLPAPLGLSAQTPEQWQAAARSIRRLPPDSFPELPAAIRSTLRVRGCTIPQSFVDSNSHNVVTGRFAHAGQRDWAVLCSRHDSSSVLIFWGERGHHTPEELGRTSDADFLQGIGAGRIGYSRVITVADPSRIRAYGASFDGPLPAPLDHDGLEDAFAGKASAVFYRDKGRWLTLAGAD